MTKLKKKYKIKKKKKIQKFKTKKKCNIMSDFFD